MSPFKTLHVGVHPLTIRIVAPGGSLYDFLERSLAAKLDHPFPPDITIRIKQQRKREGDGVPRFDPGHCKPIDGHFNYAPGNGENFFQTYRCGRDFVHRRGSREPSTLAVWRYAKREGEIFVCTKEPRGEEFRLAVFTLLREALKGFGYFPIHCAALAKGVQAALIPAHGGTGKTALSLALLERSFSFLSDDTVFLAQNEGMLTVTRFPEMPRIGSGHLDLFPEINFPNLPPESDGVTKWHVPLDDTFPGARLETAFPSLMLFLVKSRERLLFPIDSNLAYLHLLEQASFLGSRPDYQKTYTMLLRKLAATTRSYMAGSPDPRELASWIENLMDRR